ncbi:MAG: type III-A CRISPR-associated RAMP protein Csm4 [Bryobacteraceae bacterium]
MNPGLVVKLRPSGPWRIGPDSGARDQVDTVYHSDSLFSAVTWAMASLGRMEEWLDSTAKAETSAVSFSSCFPFLGDINLVTPPRTFWPPAPTSKVRWKGARFVPLSVVEARLNGTPLDEDRWWIDGLSACLLPSAATHGPFRPASVSSAAVDRLNGNAEIHTTACLTFAEDAGVWTIVSFADEAARDRWLQPLQAALRLLADSGLGGERSRGWGHAQQPEFLEGNLPDMILPARVSPESESPENSWWLLSLFTPGERDLVDWTRGNYTTVVRDGRVLSPQRSGDRKKSLQMVSEGSVLHAPEPIRGAARDVAPDGFPHPVYRAGFALAILLGAQGGGV